MPFIDNQPMILNDGSYAMPQYWDPNGMQGAYPLMMDSIGQGNSEWIVNSQIPGMENQNFGFPDGAQSQGIFSGNNNESAGASIDMGGTLGNYSDPLSMPFGGGGLYYDDENAPYRALLALSPSLIPTSVDVLPEAELDSRLQKTLQKYTEQSIPYQWFLPSALMYYSLPYGAEASFLTNIIRGDMEEKSENQVSERVYVLGVLCWNIPTGGKVILREVNGHVMAQTGFGRQRVNGEFLAVLSFAHIALNYELRIGEKHFTVQNLVDSEKENCVSDMDLSMVAIGLAYYLKPNEVWTVSDGQNWSLDRLVQEELKRPVDWAARESADKLLALTMLLRRMKTDSPDKCDSIESFLATIKDQVISFRGENGLWNTAFLIDGERSTHPLRVLQTSAHLLRWLVLYLPDSELRTESMRQSVYALSLLIEAVFPEPQKLSQLSTLEMDLLGTGLHALSIYRQRTQH